MSESTPPKAPLRRGSPVSLLAVADRLDAIASVLDQVPEVPAGLSDELHCAAQRCWAVFYRQHVTLESFDFQLLQLERLRDQLGGCLGEDAHDQPVGEMLPDSLDLGHLRPDVQGRYAWDRWEASALAAGVEQALARLGRAVMREAAQHDWNPSLRGECGWNDQGQAMIELALGNPQAAEERWDYLLNTDGGRGRWTEQGEWRPFDR